MPLASSRRLALGALAVAYGCTTGSPATPVTAAPSDDGGTVAATGLKFVVDPGLACSNGVGICVAPSQVVTFAVEGEAGTVVNLSLQGAYADAALTAQSLTLTGGLDDVTLESASTTAMFSIVAAIGGAGSSQSISLAITVSQSGSATIDATAVYTGHRPDVDFYATDFVLSTCAEITAEPPDAAAETWTEGASDGGVQLVVPAGERVAVNVRIGHYAFGCSDVDPLVPSVTSVVPVQVYDVPMALSLTNLNAVFSYTPSSEAATGWQAVGQAASARVLGAFFPLTAPDGSTEPDGSALLDAMSAAIVAPADQAQFNQRRSTAGWDTTANDWMSSHPPSLASRAATWLSAGEAAGVGPLALNIGPEPSGGSTAPVTVASFGALSWASAGITQPAPFQWTADANDTVHLAGTITLASTPLFAHEADAQAAASGTGATDVPSSLALGIDCAGLAGTLVGSGVSYGTCAASCTANLCAAALTAVWKSASAPAGGGVDTVSTAITASAPADVGDLAEPAFVQGGWVGTVAGPGVPVTDAGASFPVSGTLLATEPQTADAGP